MFFEARRLPYLHKMIMSDLPIERREALDALLKLDSQRQRDLLVEIIGDSKANRLAIVQAVNRISETWDPSYIEALLPLTDIPGRAYSPDDFTHAAYWTITRLLNRVDIGKPDGATARRSRPSFR